MGLSVGLLLSGFAVSSAVVRAEPPRSHADVLDDRYHHGHFYPRRGAVIRELPPGYHPYWHHGSQFYFAGGVWYAPGPHGFIVTRPPAGLIVRVLPPSYTTVWIGGVPYYYADEVYYRWAPESNGYEVVDPPEGADHPGSAPQLPTGAFYIYPKNGQTPEQQSADRYDCYSWSKNQTGFDPTQPSGGVPADQLTAKGEQYRRAMTACLDARGYSVQ